MAMPFEVVLLSHRNARSDNDHKMGPVTNTRLWTHLQYIPQAVIVGTLCIWLRISWSFEQKMSIYPYLGITHLSTHHGFYPAGSLLWKLISELWGRRET